ncbi:MAG: hypothetical protein JWQ25_3240, partial [Daejeonella sp.]|nr:hypothetical protein [Daejeonella sp.]
MEMIKILNPIIFLSGADRSILVKLPNHDRKPYLWIGFYNLIGAAIM